MLAVGMIPLVGGLSGTYYIGRRELQEVIGTSFRVLAEDGAAKVDAAIQKLMTVDRIWAHKAADGYVVRTLGHPFGSKDLSTVVPFNWPLPGEDTETHKGLIASWITGPELGGPEGAKSAALPTKKAATMAWLEHNKKTERYQFHLSTPIIDLDEKDKPLLGWLHRTYDLSKLLNPLTYPIRFGDTGHVMIIDNSGMIVSCPLLETGSRVTGQTFITRLTSHQPGWITAKNNGHGELVFSIIGHAPLTGVNSIMRQGVSWHMFVWQDSEEIFAPMTHLLMGVAISGLIALGLLAAIGYYASRRIVKPIHKLRLEATRIAGGDLSQPLVIHTGDEIEDLAGEFDEMRIQLRQHIGTLEDKLTGSERHFRAVAESANDAIISADADTGNIMGWNAAAERLFGYTKAEITDQPLTMLMPERFRNPHREGLARVATGGVTHVIGKTVELAGLRKDGSEFPLELSLAQWQGSDGQFFTGFIRDITERKQKEEELRKSQAEKERVLERLIQTEKVAAIGTMASGIGHEINNPLYVISGMAEAIRDEKNVAACNEYGHDMLKYAKEIAVIVKNLSGYSRPASRDELEEVDVHERLTNAIAMARLSRLDDHIEIRQELSPVPSISAKPEEIKQVFFNIIRNGMQAMAGEGILKLSTSLEDDQVCIRIRDTGAGIKEENLSKIFDPFFTTKGPDEGEGLGMYIVQKIIKKYGGAIAVESEEGKGTMFTITFPAIEPAKPEDA